MGSLVRSRKVEGKEAKTRKQLQKCRQFDGTFVHVKQFSNWFYFRIGKKPDFFNAFSGAFWIWKCNILRVSQKTHKNSGTFRSVRRSSRTAYDRDV